VPVGHVRLVQLRVRDSISHSLPGRLRCLDRRMTARPSSRVHPAADATRSRQAS
jgi:hypothetical protein